MSALIPSPHPGGGEFLLYQSEDGRTKLDVRLVEQTVWLSQKQLTELFGKAKGTISEHIKHIFEDQELEEASVVRFYRTTAADGKTYDVAHYNLDMVLALGFNQAMKHLPPPTTSLPLFAWCPNLSMKKRSSSATKATIIQPRW